MFYLEDGRYSLTKILLAVFLLFYSISSDRITSSDNRRDDVQCHCYHSTDGLLVYYIASGTTLRPRWRHAALSTRLLEKKRDETS